MAYGLYLVLDQSKWFRNDFSDEDKLTGTIYTDINQTTAKDLTGYTIVVKMFRENGVVAFFDEVAAIEVAANGTWSLAVEDGDMPLPDIWNVKVELQKSGSQVSTLNKVELHILEGPSD